MSTFKAEVTTISEVRPHGNADRLELGKVKGLDFQFVIQKGSYKVGDLVVYFPVDSVFPDELVEKLGLDYLSKNRVRTIKLRGEYSQGLVLPVKDLPLSGVKPGNDVTKQLGIVKYEVPVKLTNIGRLRSLPLGLTAYDIEGYERYPDAVEYLMDKPVQVTEKLEGTNFSLTVTKSGKVFVNSRNHTIEEESYTWWEKIRRWWVGQKTSKKRNIYWETMRSQPELLGGAQDALKIGGYEWVTIYGELCGPQFQKNIYGFKEHRIFVFDVLTDKGWMSPLSVENYSNSHVPVLFTGKLSDYLGSKTITEASNGQSVLAPVLREGIVIKPLVPQDFPGLGRLILKKRSPQYLANEHD